jgi:hypothetical protein
MDGDVRSNTTISHADVQAHRRERTRQATLAGAGFLVA